LWSGFKAKSAANKNRFNTYVGLEVKMPKIQNATNVQLEEKRSCITEFLMRIIHIVFISSLTFFTACFGTTKPYIPDHTEPLADGMARIILTREKQLAGAGSPIEILDIGENVNPNSMMACSYMREGNKLMDVRELAKPQYDYWVNTEFLWTNPSQVTSVSCGTSHGECGTELKNELIGQEGFLRGDVGLLLSENYYALRLTGHRRSSSRPTGILVGDTDAWTSRPVVSKKAPPLIDPSISLLEKIRQQQFETVEIPVRILSSGEYRNLQGLRISESKLPLVFHSVIKYKGDPGNAAALQRGYFYSIIIQKSILLIDNRYIDRNVQLIGRVRTGDTLIWDRKPGTLRLGALWHDGIGFMREDITIESGKHYFIHYTTKMPPKPRWELVKVE
jgi:hypothetical protein